MTIHRIKKSRQPIASILLMTMMFAFVLKAILPAGFMPENKNGYMELVICSGMGEKTILVPNEGTPNAGHQDDKAGNDICAYQILASGKILAPVDAIPLTALTFDKTPFIDGNSYILTSHDILPFDARGPPSA